MDSAKLGLLLASMLLTVHSGAAQQSTSAADGNAQGSTQPASSDVWQFQFTPYFFMAGVKGTVGVSTFTSDVDVPFSKVIDQVNFGFMGTFEAHKNKFTLLADLLYMDLGDSQANAGPLFSSAEANFKEFILDPEVGYRLAETKGASLDVVGGIRYWHARMRLELHPGVLPGTEVEGSRNWMDAVGGLRGRAHLSPRWFVTGKADFGGGGSDFTFQFFGAIGANVGKRASLIVGYRYLKVDYDAEGFLFDMAMKGPLFGLGFRF